MKRFLILTAAFGEGHNTAARALCEALASLGYKAEVADLFVAYGESYQHMRRNYLRMVNHTPVLWDGCYRMMDALPVAEWGVRWFMPKLRRAFETKLRSFKPDAIISCYPAYTELRNRTIAKNLPYYSVITDTESVNHVWFRRASDAYFVPDRETARLLARNGIQRRKIFPLGFAVSTAFDRKQSRTLPCANDPAKLLFIVNQGNPNAEEWIASLSARKDIALTVAAGNNQALCQYARKIADTAANPMKIIGWADNMPELLQTHHIALAKSGGAMTHECIAAGIPMLISQVFAGQEAGNARKVVRAGAAVLALDIRHIHAPLSNWLAGGAEGWRQAQKAMESLSTPCAALRIAQTVVEISNYTPSWHPAKPQTRFSIA